MRWAIEHVNPENGDNELIAAARAAGHEVTVIRPERDIPADRFPQAPLLFHGSIQKAQELLAERPDIRSGIWLDEQAFRCTAYLAKIPPALLFNQQYRILTVEQVQQDKWEVYKEFARDAKIFIRPDSGLKTFTGQLLDLQDFDRFWANPRVCSAKPQDLVLIAEPAEIQGEWRYIADETGKVIASSTYMYQGNRTYVPGAPQGATQICQEVLDAGLRLGPMFLLDIAQATDGRYGLLEVNAFSTGALYAAKMESIVARAAELMSI